LFAGAAPRKGDVHGKGGKHGGEIVAALNWGEIPAEHRVVRDQSVASQPTAWNQRIYDAGLKVQNYEKGFERFVPKFDPDEEVNATLAIVKGVHHEHGTAVYFTQKTRRCLLLDTTHGLSEEEALWYTLLSWAKFQPPLKRPRTDPGRLFYPAEHSCVFEKYWDHLDCPEDHPEFSQETPFTQDCMRNYASALHSINLENFTPLVHAEAKEVEVEIATEAAISRLLPIRGFGQNWTSDSVSEDVLGFGSTNSDSGMAISLFC
jgi:hypothetical protein